MTDSTAPTDRDVAQAINAAIVNVTDRIAETNVPGAVSELGDAVARLAEARSVFQFGIGAMN